MVLYNILKEKQIVRSFKKRDTARLLLIHYVNN